VSFCQSLRSLDRSTSSMVQKLASDCLYIVQKSSYLQHGAPRASAGVRCHRGPQCCGCVAYSMHSCHKHTIQS
jgi:hypothetical protein